MKWQCFLLCECTHQTRSICSDWPTNMHFSYSIILYLKRSDIYSPEVTWMASFVPPLRNPSVYSIHMYIHANAPCWQTGILPSICSSRTLTSKASFCSSTKVLRSSSRLRFSSDGKAIPFHTIRILCKAQVFIHDHCVAQLIHWKISSRYFVDEAAHQTLQAVYVPTSPWNSFRLVNPAGVVHVYTCFLFGLWVYYDHAFTWWTTMGTTSEPRKSRLGDGLKAALSRL